MNKLSSYKYYTTIFLVCWAIFSNAQELKPALNFKHIKTEFGLSDAIVRGIVQDKQGYMWFGTDNGLNRYDGYQFVKYYQDDNDSSSLSNNSITCILKRNNEELWIGTHEGLNLFNIKTEKNQRFKFKQDDINSIKGNYIFTLLEDKNANLWIGTNKGLSYYDNNSKKVIRIDSLATNYKGITDKEIWALSLQGSDSLWIGTGEDGLFLYHIHTKQFKQFTVKDGFLSDNISCLFYHKDGDLLIGHWQNGLTKYNLKTNEMTTYRYNPENDKTLSSNLINSIYQDQDENIWIGLWGGGINLFNIEAGEFHRYTRNNLEKNSIINNDINSFYQDQTGLMWVGTWGGLSYFEPSTKSFSTLNHKVLGNSFIDYTKCIFISSDKNLWIGTEGNGLYRYDDSYKLIAHYTNSAESPDKKISSNYVYTISEDYRGNIWVGTWNGGVNVINTKNNTIETYTANDSTGVLLGNIIHEILQEKEVTWLNTSQGINKYLHSTKSFENIVLPFEFLSEDLEHPWVYSLVRDKNNILWMGTDNGLFHLNDKTNEITPFPSSDSSKIRINDKIIKVIKEDNNGNIWLGTTKGVHLINKDRTESFVYDKSNGLFEENIQALEFDNNGDVWVTTYRGISNIKVKQNKVWNYNANDGLQNNQFNTKSSFKDENGIIYFGGIEGINYFNPLHISNNSPPPQIAFSNLKIFNKTVNVNTEINKKIILEYPINHLEEIHLSYLESIFTIEFAALHYSNTKDNSYQYRLLGLSNQWTNPSKDNFATFTNLSEGTYTLEVKAASSKGVWNETPAKLSIIIHPPWWRSFWFITIMILIALLSVLGLFYWRSSFFERQRNQLKVQIDKQTLQLRLANVRLENQTKEIIEQNNELQIQKEELTQQHEELKTVVENLKNTQSKLVQAEKMAALGQLTAGIAHEINNPVNFINSGIIGLKKGIQQVVKISKLVDEINEDNIQEKLHEIADLKHKVRYLHLLKMLEKVSGNIEIGAQRTAEIVKGLRTFSRQDSEKTAIINLHEGIDSTLVLLHNQYKNKLRIIKEYGEIPMIECYPGKINQVFMNLISNAIDAIEPNGEGWIKITTQNYSDGKVKVSIEDNGKGMSKDLQEKIFEPFFTTKEVGKGTGLGLSITIGIVNDHHGDVEIISEPSEGTTFHLYFPIKQIQGIETES